MSNLDEFLEKRVQEMSERTREKQTQWENHVKQFWDALNALEKSEHECLRKFRKDHLYFTGNPDLNHITTWGVTSRKYPIFVLFRGRIPDCVTYESAGFFTCIDSCRFTGNLGEKVLELLLDEAKKENYLPQ